MTPQEELSVREELALSPAPERELSLRESLSDGEVVVNSASTKEKDTTLMDRITEKHKSRQEEVSQTFEDYSKDEITTAEAILQTVGKGGAGATLDIVGEVVTTAAVEGWDLLPESVQKPVQETAKSGWKSLMESDVGRLATEAINSGVEAWGEFSDANPQAAKDIESLTNIGALLMPVKAKANAEPTFLGKLAKRGDDIVDRQIKKSRDDFVGELISPKQTAKVKIAETARTSEKGKGLLKRSVIELSQREKDIAEEVFKIKNVSPKKSIQGNLNEIVKENRVLSKQLDRDVGKRNYLTLKSDTAKNIDNAVDTLVSENPVITGNAEIVAKKVANKAKQIISDNPSTPKGLLDSRKQLDSWIRRQKGQKVFDPELESALSVAVREVRNTINNSIDDTVSNVAVKEELRRQSLLFDAIENMGAKAADESNTAIGRAMQNASKILPFRDKFLRQAGTAFGLGYVAASEALAPVFATGLGVLIASKGAYGIVTSAKTKQALISLVKGVDRAILSSKNPSMIKQLRSDRAAIIELIKTSNDKEQTGE